MSRKSLGGGFLGLVLVWSAFGGVLLPGTGWAQWVKLSDGGTSRVSSFEISPRGDRVVYYAVSFLGVREIVSVPMAGGTPVRLHGPLPAGASGCLGFPRFSPDGSRVVFACDLRVAGIRELYSAPIDGGSPAVRLSESPLLGGDVTNFVITPDGSRVVYRGDQQTDEVFEVYSVPITGGTVVKLNGTLIPAGDVRFLVEAGVSPDSSRVVYLADQEVDEKIELYSVPTAGGAVVKLNGALVAGGDVKQTGFGAGPGGNRVVYVADQEVDEQFELYSVPIAGGAAVKLNGALVAGGYAGFPFQITPDGSRVVYRAEQDFVGIPELYSVPIAGGSAVKLNGAIFPGTLGVQVDFSITPDGGRVLYRAPQQTAQLALYSVPIAGGTALKLNNTGVPAASVTSFKLSPDGKWVVYDQDFDFDRRRGFMASPSGPAESGVLAWGDNLLARPTSGFYKYLIEPGSGNVVVLAVKLGEPDPVSRLWRAPLRATHNFSARELIPKADFVTGAEIDPDEFFGFFIGPDGSVVYIADQDTDNVFELYAIPGVLFSDGFE